MQRNRLACLALIVLVMGAGLASRTYPVSHVSEFIAAYAGDTLWALMVFLVVGLGFPRLRTSIVAAVAIAVAFTVETSQLYQSNWINQIRATRPGALLLGVGFLWSDFVCYTVGILIGYTGEAFCLNLRVNKSVNKSE